MAAEPPPPPREGQGEHPEAPTHVRAPARRRPPAPGRISSSIAALKLIGGLVALFFGLLAIVVIVLLALLIAPSDSTGVATAAITASGTMVGAYFGVKIGTDGTRKTIDAMRQESAKAQAYALAVPDHTSATNAISHATALMAAQGIDAAGAEE